MKKLLLVVTLFVFGMQSMDASPGNETQESQLSRQLQDDLKGIQSFPLDGARGSVNDGGISFIYRGKPEERSGVYYQLSKQEVEKLPLLKDYFDGNSEKVGYPDSLSSCAIYSARIMITNQILKASSGFYGPRIILALRYAANGNKERLSYLKKAMSDEQWRNITEMQIGNIALGDIVEPSFFSYEKFSTLLQKAKAFKHVQLISGITISGLIMFLLLYNRSAAQVG